MMQTAKTTFHALFLLAIASALAPAVVAAKAGLPDFTGLVERYGAAVVNISTTQKMPVQRNLPHGLEMPDIPEDSPFYEFFRRFFGERGEGGGGGGGGRLDTQSLGSGFIISADGYVVTNNHVIEGADEIVVRLSDRREMVAELIGTDARSDLALLKLEANDLPVVKLGSSRDLRVGEWVLAIGSPFGFDHSVTAGIVSAKGRSLPTENYIPFIQTDVAINPGNSGGPLFNLDGEVVGVNSQIYSRTGGFMGLSFAIPVDMAMDVVAQLKDNGKVSRGWLGVLIQDVTHELAESFGMDRPRGALVARVLPDSPADRAGFQVGDVVLEFDGKGVNESSDLPPIVGATRAGQTVPVHVLRQGQRETLRVTIDELPDDSTLAQAQRQGPQDTARNARLGLVVKDLTDPQRQELELGDRGVYVESVDDGAAYRAGVRAGDVILMVNNEDVRTTADFNRIVAELPGGKAVPVLVQRLGNPLFLALKPGQ